MRKVFLEDLPRKYGIGANKDILVIDWIKSIGMLVRFIYDDIEGSVEIVGYDGKELHIKYKDKEPFKTKTGNFKRCKIGKLLGKYTDEFKIVIGTHYKDEKRDIIIIDREYRKNTRINKGTEKEKWYKYICNKCNYEGFIKESNLNKGDGCGCCAGQTIVLGINTIWDTDRWMCDLGVSAEDAKKYAKCSNKYITVKCSNCGKVKDNKISINNIYRFKSIGCTCGDGFSYGHKYVHNLLTQLNLDFEDNKTFDWCVFYNSFKERETTGEYDFVVENIELIVEVDGDFHREDNRISGQTKEHSKYLDDIKDLKAYENGYKVIRISDEGSIRDNIIKSELINYFKFDTIDWDKCEEFALSNRVKEACELKHDNPDISTTEIGMIMKLSRNTIINYLKQGSKVWDWINYNPKEEVKKATGKNGRSLGKKVEIFKDGILLMVFESCSELSRQSEKLFGVKLLSGEISNICNGKRRQYKGFTFRYV